MESQEKHQRDPYKIVTYIDVGIFLKNCSALLHTAVYKRQLTVRSTVFSNVQRLHACYFKHVPICVHIKMK